MPARVANIAPCITQVTFKLVHYALLIYQLRFVFTFLKVLANFPTDKYGLDCGLGLNAKVFQLCLNNVSRSLKSLFSRLDYPHHLINSTINTFVNSRVSDQQPLQASEKMAGIDVTRIVIPFKDQDSANIVKTQLKDLSIKLQTTIQPVFVSRKIGQDLQECENKPQLVNQQCVVYQFKCNLCDTGSYVGYTRGHLHARVDGHKSTSSSVRKHYDNDHAGAVPEDLLSCFKVIKKCRTKFDCLVNEMLYIKQLTPSLNVQTDSIRAKVFV